MFGLVNTFLRAPELYNLKYKYTTVLTVLHLPTKGIERGWGKYETPRSLFVTLGFSSLSKPRYDFEGIQGQTHSILALSCLALIASWLVVS